MMAFAGVRCLVSKIVDCRNAAIHLNWLKGHSQREAGMKRQSLQVLAFGFAAALSWQVHAKSADAVPAAGSDEPKPVATVRTDGGVIMLSKDGAPFVTAVPNEAAYSGQRMMVAKDSIATVIYNDGCEQKYDKPGVYKIDPGCKRAAALWGGGSTTTVLAAVGGAVVGGLVADQFCDCHCPPVSR